MRQWFVGAFSFTVKEVIGALIALIVGVIALILYNYTWVSGRPLVLTFQVEMGCPNGKLSLIKEHHFEDRMVQLDRGAESLFICDTESLTTTRQDAPSALALKYPACLKKVGSTLSMLRASPAICSLPNETGYVCDGPNAHEYPGSSSIGVEGGAVKQCGADVLKRFGFAS
ncbi:hypothetical protein NKI86_24120 [Mesorhizobium sp. M0320]|uniref:hypothetical protein n=1 Tax=unclassified Mesorhizobium TaxID=325217 RepID=UPI00333CC439